MGTPDEIDRWTELPRQAWYYPAPDSRWFIYKLFWEGVLIYIGMSNDVVRRVHEHYIGIGGTSRKKFDRVQHTYVCESPEATHCVEQYLVRTLRPRLNNAPGERKGPLHAKHAMEALRFGFCDLKDLTEEFLADQRRYLRSKSKSGPAQERASQARGLHLWIKLQFDVDISQKVTANMFGTPS